ncbi:MAG: hypothetical protein B0W54_01590 [Cellvibrio sp. 79]|nr:MAG: hypothetical protein B0W54_01590 [Cellvibrio sp. 79]
MNSVVEPAFVGNSPAFNATMKIISRIARCEAITLIQGETGTGKELAARAIHYLSPRSDHPFIPVNCAAIPDSLFESEIFGHVKGAFTDAKENQIGLVEHAEGGTLFLDEIECLSAKGQATLLRFLQDQIYRPIGGKDQVANLRVVVATNRDLLAMTRSGEFRLDLYYRLALLRVTIPALRERAGDPEFLANHFIKLGCKRFGLNQKFLHPDAIEWLNTYDWPGNVRELENFIYNKILLSEEDSIVAGELTTYKNDKPASDNTQEALFNLTFDSAKKQLLNNFAQQYLSKLLARTNGNISAAARLAGKERRTFTRLLEKNGIEK